MSEVTVCEARLALFYDDRPDSLCLWTLQKYEHTFLDIMFELIGKIKEVKPSDLAKRTLVVGPYSLKIK